MATDGRRIAVGATGADAPANAGSVFLFERVRGGWNRVAELRHDTPAISDRLGIAVGVSGDRVVAGANRLGLTPPTNAGGLVVFVRDGAGWIQEAVLNAPVTDPSSDFGETLDISGDRLVAGAPLLDLGAQRAGAAWVWRRGPTGWAVEADLTPPGLPDFAQFGSDVAIDGDRIAVGAPGDQLGAVHLFVLEDEVWIPEQVVRPSAGVAPFGTGRAVDLEGSLLIAGVANDGIGSAHQAGTVLAFDRGPGGWSQTARIQASDPIVFERMGSDVALAGATILAGTSPLPTPGQGGFTPPGAVRQFVRSGTAWTQRTRLETALGTPTTTYGRVAAAGDLAVVGDPGGGGAAYAFGLIDPPATYCGGKTSSAGCVPFLTTQGTPTVVPGFGFQVRANDVLPGEPGILLYGFAPAGLGFHGGKLCVKAPQVRLLPPQIAGSTGPGACDGLLKVNFNARIQSGADAGLTAGRRVHAQWLTRDPADPAGFGDGLSDGVAFTICP